MESGKETRARAKRMMDRNGRDCHVEEMGAKNENAGLRDWGSEKSTRKCSGIERSQIGPDDINIM